MRGTKWGALQPYFGRFRLDTGVEHLTGPSQIPPIARPVEMTSVPDAIASFQDMCLAMRNCLVSTFPMFERLYPVSADKNLLTSCL